MGSVNSGRFVLVTGASTGIGAATVDRLAGSGWNVIAAVRDDESARRLDATQGCTAVEFDLDVGAEAAVGGVVEQVASVVGPSGLAALVNNAGYVEAGPFETVDVERWRRQFEVNVFGPVELTRRLVPLMRRAVEPRVVMVGSISGRVGAPMLGPYSASKHALDGVVKCLRREAVAIGLSASIVEPGAVSTPLWAKADSLADRIEAGLDADLSKRYRRLIAAQRVALADGARDGLSPDAVAQVIEMALTSSRPRARYLVGRDAKAGGVLDRLLPDFAMEFVGRKLIDRAIGAKNES